MQFSGISTVFGLSACLALGGAIYTRAAEDPKPAAGPTAGQQFKNIKVLNDLPASQLLAVMQEYSSALGVECAFCHEGGDFASDKNTHKVITREMIVLTQNLNKNEPSVKNQVTCFMCHHGRPEPFARAADAQKAAKEKADKEAAKKKAQPNGK